MSRRTALPTLLLAGLCSAAALAQTAAGGRADSCGACHAQLPNARLREPALLLRAKDVHAARGLSCASCHGGDASASSGQAAHGAGFKAKPADAEAIAALCGRCHAAPAEGYLKGPHHLARNAVRRPDCVTCHGAHGVAPASIELIGEPLCSSCHPLARARRIHKAVAGAEHELAALDEQLARSGDQDGQARLLAARTELRGLTHALDLFAVTRQAAQAFAVVDDVRATSLPLLGARDWARRLRAGGLALGSLLLLAAVALVVRLVWTRRGRLPALQLPKSGAVKLLAAVGLLLAVGALAGAKRSFDFVEHDPKFCTSCHTMGSAYELWEKSGHRNIECHTCHLANPVDNLHQLWVYTTRRPDEVVKHAEIDRSICEKCHTGEGNRSKWNRIIDTPGHRIHAVKNRVECVQCHAMSVHRFKPPKEVCATCHKQITLTAAGTMSEMHCLQCHSFTAVDPKRPLRPDRAACLECHEGRRVADEVFPEKAPMKWDCGRCHKPHQKKALDDGDCRKCHLGVDEGIHKAKAHQACLDCHRPHGWNTQPAACLSCHKGLEKHYPGKACGSCHGAADP